MEEYIILLERIDRAAERARAYKARLAIDPKNAKPLEQHVQELKRILYGVEHSNSNTR